MGKYYAVQTCYYSASRIHDDAVTSGYIYIAVSLMQTKV